MYDINFYRTTHFLRKEIMNGKYSLKDVDVLNKLLMVSNGPIVYNIETTNACNMCCSFCPRRLMTRPIETMSLELFIKCIEQIKSGWSKEEWNNWKLFCSNEYGIEESDMSENHFFLYIISKCLTLHGFGEPLLDKTIAEKIRLCSMRGIETYFSCNANNLKIKKVEELFDAGLGYIKFSIDSVYDERIKKIRGKNADFTTSYRNILDLLKIKEKNNYKTTVVITMIETEDFDIAEWGMLNMMFNDNDVYIYLKSLNTKWICGNEKNNNSIDWNGFCCFPWFATTIKSNGDVTTCSEDYNNELVFGNIQNEKLVDIWNSDKYSQLRKEHLIGNGCNKCFNRCERRKVVDFLK